MVFSICEHFLLPFVTFMCFVETHLGITHYSSNTVYSFISLWKHKSYFIQYIMISILLLVLSQRIGQLEKSPLNWLLCPLDVKSLASALVLNWILALHLQEGRSLEAKYMEGSENQRDVCQYQRVRYLNLFIFSGNLLIYSNLIEMSMTYNIMYKVYFSLTHVIYCKMISTIMWSNTSITLHNYHFFFHGENI